MLELNVATSKCLITSFRHPDPGHKDLGHFWLGYMRMLGHLQLSAHLPNLECLNGSGNAPKVPIP